MQIFSRSVRAWGPVIGNHLKMNNNRWKQIVVFVLMSLLLGDLSNGQQAQPQILDSELESMSDQELELICIERGFELIRDESDEGLTHDDYIDAAKRCLAIEADMNEILMQNPELADELLSEVDRLKEEKDRMEEERAKMLAEKERLEAQLVEKQNQQQGHKNDSLRMWGAAHVEQPASEGLHHDNAPRSEGPAKTHSAAVFAQESSENRESYDDRSHDGTKSTISALDTLDGEENDIPIDDYDYVHVDDKNETEKSDPSMDECITETGRSEAATETSENSDFSLTGFIQGIMTEFENDIHRIARLILPIVRPLLDAKDFAWKYLRAMFHSAKQQMEMYQQKQESAQKKSNTSNEMQLDE